MLHLALQRCPHCVRLASSRASFCSSAAIQQKAMHKRTTVSPQPHDDYDFVGPPNPHSNMRKFIYAKPRSTGEEVLNTERVSTNQWNDEFWKDHNKHFFDEKKEFIEKANAASGTGQEVADKLSVFYKEFLEKNHDTYMEYNKEWYRRNFSILWMDVKNLVTKPFIPRKKIATSDAT